ncbi:hypothetical protein DM02DRAFT_634087 [Periconia macrospinosa]|uniref:Uncharacterized protein n=1 Tax=Periconia macrospinosa TaxID=97972 RepID=A0A2V1D793_9PLEO|nr:hypothetical protein DM02DRAFT_634087 [Periconia macrospinosa]
MHIAATAKKGFRKALQGFVVAPSDDHHGGWKQEEDESLLGGDNGRENSESFRGEKLLREKQQRRRNIFLPRFAIAVSALCHLVLLWLYIRAIRQEGHKSPSSNWMGYEGSSQPSLTIP